MQEHLRTDALQPVNTAKKSDGGRFGVKRSYAGRKHRELREGRAPGRHFADSLNIKMHPTCTQYGFEFFLLGKGGGGVLRAREDEGERGVVYCECLDHRLMLAHEFDK